MPDRPAPHRILMSHYMGKRQDGIMPVAGADWTVIDPELPAENTMNLLARLSGELRRETAAALNAGKMPVALCGDCCSAIGMTAGLRDAGIVPVLIWLDAHGDFNTWDTTPSGFIGGMPAAMLTGRGEQTIMNAVELEPVADERIIMSDARDLDREEKVLVAESGIAHLPKLAQLLDHPLPDAPIHVHFDTDVIDPADAPAQNYLAPGGPPLDDFHAVFKRLRETGRIAAISVTGWNPEMDGAEQTKRVCLELTDLLIEG